jgi:hypothetical protein
MGLDLGSIPFFISKSFSRGLYFKNLNFEVQKIKMNKQKATLLLADGTIFNGTLIGSPGTNGGEICFNTGMTGYQEIYTDPSYTGQIIVTTTSHIGNYGVIDTEVESDHPTIAE